MYKFPDMLDLWKERGIYRDSYWIEANDSDLHYHCGDFGDKMKVPYNTRIAALSLLGKEFWRFLWDIQSDATPCWKAINIGGGRNDNDVFGVY
ncbi:hypothetical protein AVEN_167438-1 [Araneus ventricosus]|uniref:Uncharacterized protein n=1 Tax=Araneus ventricosus TaxID=182803 RepID=A0A4Y2EL96_ARAVE|nr:hypothetical protein AVEN_167438-1 [Araneus ventricosus]